MVGCVNSACLYWFKMAFNGDGPHNKRQRTEVEAGNHRVSDLIFIVRFSLSLFHELYVTPFYEQPFRTCVELNWGCVLPSIVF